MSCRCQLRFTEEESEYASQVFRHSYGNPENVLSNLDHLKRLLQVTMAKRTAAYTAAQFVFVDKLWSLEQSFRDKSGSYNESPKSVAEVLKVDSWKECSPTPSYLLGHGVEDPASGIHGDEDFLYVVEVSDTKYLDWRVKIAGRDDFPRDSREETERAFELADWRFEGTLEEGLAKVEGKR
ncbi:hypothetical protein HYG81_21330 (plasmid) [Natrinema zhouii]|uniref:hypothetical protein n=1 Tax=Natrinema zhouii TaxID=1710539 RepID=UPI001CFFD3F0|nr:hypothetical protein [Natrinema zhouii]UHQ98124.1 hypothetical protein HYG81_21330 [Natrinema zhouii]